MLQQYCDIEEDDLMEMEPWKTPPEETFLSHLSTQSQNSREKWISVLKRRIKKKHLEEERKAAEQGTVKRIKFHRPKSEGEKKIINVARLSGKLGKKSPKPLPDLAPKSPVQKSKQKKLPAIKKGRASLKGKCFQFLEN